MVNPPLRLDELAQCVTAWMTAGPTRTISTAGLMLHRAARLCIGAGIKLGIKGLLLESRIGLKALCLLPWRGGRAVDAAVLKTMAHARWHTDWHNQLHRVFLVRPQALGKMAPSAAASLDPEWWQA